MFDCLVGSKFSFKCKHAVKCTRSRIEAIWKKKKAMVWFLKKDIADLIAAGHESNAFERLDVLICEINHASCYEMIKKFCEVVLNQLPSLRKLRECPQGAVEAVSTLIFAAARFSDLPELCDLRHIFTDRYGGPMESFINAEFVEKIQQKTFSKEDKLQMMQNIAEEFSVRWDSWAFEHKSSNSPARKYEQPKKVVPLHSVNNATLIMPTESTKVQSLPRKKHELKATTIEQWHGQTDSKDNHMISTVNPSNAPCEKARKAEANEIENVKPYLDDGVLRLYDNQISNQTYGNDEPEGVWYNKTAKVLEKVDPIVPEKKGVYLMKPLNEKQVIPSYAKSNESNNYCQVTEKIRNGSQDDSSQRYAEMVYPAEKKRQPTSVVPPYVKPKVSGLSVINDVKAIQKLDSACPTKLNVICDDHKDEILGNAAVTGSLQKLTGSEANDSVLTETIDRAFYDENRRSRTPRDRRRYTRRQSASSMHDYYDNGKTMKKYHGEPIDGEVDTRKGHQGRHIAGANVDYYHDTKTSCRHPREPIDDEMDNRRRHASWKNAGCFEEYNDVGKTVDRHPTGLINDELDIRRRHRSSHSASNDCDYYDNGKTIIRHLREHIDGEMDSRRRYSSWKSVGPKVEYYEENHTRSRHQNEPSHRELDNRRQNRGRKNEYDNFVCYDKGKITTRYTREPTDGQKDNHRRHTGWRSAGTISEFYAQMDTAVDHRRLAERTPTPNRSRRNRDWQDATRYDEYDNDEMAMDRLLMHYSRKGTPRRSTHKTRRNRNPLRDHALDSDQPRASAPPLDRTTLMPPEPVGQSEVVSKVPARVESMQTNMLSSNGIRVHPRLPEYDELVARFASFQKV